MIIGHPSGTAKYLPLVIPKDNQRRSFNRTTEKARSPVWELIAEALQQSVFGIYVKAAIVIAESPPPSSSSMYTSARTCPSRSFSQKAQGQTGGGVVAPFLVRPAAFFDLAAQKSRYLAEQLVDQGIRHVYGCFRGDDRRRTCNFKFGEIRVLPYLLYAQIIVHQDFPPMVSKCSIKAPHPPEDFLWGAFCGSRRRIEALSIYGA